MCVLGRLKVRMDSLSPCYRGGVGGSEVLFEQVLAFKISS